MDILTIAVQFIISIFAGLAVAYFVIHNHKPKIEKIYENKRNELLNQFEEDLFWMDNTVLGIFNIVEKYKISYSSNPFISLENIHHDDLESLKYLSENGLSQCDELKNRLEKIEIYFTNVEIEAFDGYILSSNDLFYNAKNGVIIDITLESRAKFAQSIIEKIHTTRKSDWRKEWEETLSEHNYFKQN